MGEHFPDKPDCTGRSHHLSPVIHISVRQQALRFPVYSRTQHLPHVGQDKRHTEESPDLVDAVKMHI